MKFGRRLLVQAVAISVCVVVIGGCAGMTRSETPAQKWANFRANYFEQPESKALYLAGDRFNGPWAAGASWDQPNIALAKSAAKSVCETNRLRIGVKESCQRFFVNRELVYAPIVDPRPAKPADRTPPPTRQSRSFSTGTCFGVSEDGLIVTAAHVVSGRREVTVVFQGGDFYDANIVRSSERLDVAVLDVDTKGIPWIPFAEPESYRSGDYIFTLGFPVRGVLGDEVKFTDGSISALSGLAGEAALMQISAPIQPGSSGSPVLSEFGEIVGVVISSAAVDSFLREVGTLPQSINWATNASFIRPLLPVTVSSSPMQNRRHAIERAKRATCIVEAR